MKKDIKKIEDLYFGESFLKEFGLNAEFDGIANLVSYLKSDIKIMWILKEGNWGDDGSNDILPLVDKSKEQIEKEIDIKKERMLLHYNNVSNYSLWKRSFSRILYTNHGIISGLYKYNKLHNLDSNARILDKNFLENCIVFNIKKIPGNSTANRGIIKKFYHNHKDYLIEQIKAVNPDIILNGSGIKELSKELLPEGKYYEHDYFMKFENKMILDVYHPNARVKTEQYINHIFTIFKKHFNKIESPE